MASTHVKGTAVVVYSVRCVALMKELKVLRNWEHGRCFKRSKKRSQIDIVVPSECGFVLEMDDFIGLGTNTGN